MSSIEPLLLQRLVRRVRLVITIALLVELILCIEIASPAARTLHLAVIFPTTALSLAFLVLGGARPWVRYVAPICYSLVGAGLVSFVAQGASPVVFSAVALFAMGLPVLGGLPVRMATTISAVTVVASLGAHAHAGGEGLLELAAVLIGGLTAGGWSGWHAEVMERQDLEAHAELRRLTRSLTVQAQTDGLTGLPNRVHVEEWLEEQWERSRVQGECLSLLVVDIDHFKKINDSYGHPVGDLVLRAVAVAIQGALRGRDLAGRWGGEEFVVVLSNCPEGAVARVAERLRSSVENLKVRVPGQQETISPTVSVGAATWDGHGALDPDELVAVADRALYGAKRGGRNQVRMERTGPSPVPVD